MNRDKWSYLIFVLLLIVCGLRIVYISADPPKDLSWSGGLFFDEGALAHNARNKVLFGRWEMDEWNDFYYSPILTYIKWAVFSLGGVGLAQERIVPIGFTCLTLVLLYMTLRIRLNRLFSTVGVGLFGLNYIYLMYSRLGLTEIPTIFFTILTLYLWLSGIHAPTQRNSRLYLFLAGVSCFTVYIFKVLLVYFLPVPPVALVLLWLAASEQTERRRLIVLGGWFLGGMLLTAAVWFVSFYYPYYEVFHQAGDYVKALSLPSSLPQFWENIIRTPFFSIFSKTPVVLLSGVCYLLVPVYGFFHSRDKLDALDIFAWLWFMAHLAFFLGYSYRPTRYYLPIIPPMCILAARAIAQISRLKAIRLPHYKISAGFWIFFWLITGLLSVYGIIPVLDRILGDIIHLNSWQSVLVGGIASFVFSLALAGWLAGRRQRSIIALPRSMSWLVIICVLLVFLGINGTRYVRWFAHPRYEVRDTSRELGELLEEPAFIAGLATPALCLENQHRPLYVWKDFFNYRNTFDKYAVTHLFLAEFNNELAYYHQKSPVIMAQARLLKQYFIGGLKFYLYSLVEPAPVIDFSSGTDSDRPVKVSLSVKNNDPRISRQIEFGWAWQNEASLDVSLSTAGFELNPLEERIVAETSVQTSAEVGLRTGFFSTGRDIYEAEKLQSVIGKIRPDVEASQGYARYAGRLKYPDGGYLTYGPYRTYPSGMLHTDFVLKYSMKTATSAMQNDTALVFIDVSGEMGQNVIARKVLSVRDFERPDRYQHFRLSYTLPLPQALEFRVLSYGQADIWVDQIVQTFESEELQQHRIMLKSFEGERMHTEIGKQRSDAQASDGHALYAVADQKGGLLAFGRYASYPKGVCFADFTMKSSWQKPDRNNHARDTLATLEAVADNGRIVEGTRDVHIQDFQHMGTYQTFRLSYALESPRTLEFRIHSFGLGEIWLDKIAVYCVDTTSEEYTPTRSQK